MHTPNNHLSSNTSDLNGTGTLPADAAFVVMTVTANSTTTNTTTTTTTTTPNTTRVGNTSTNFAVALDQDELTRATAVLMSFSPNSARARADKHASNRTPDGKSGAFVPTAALQERHALSESSGTGSSSSHPLNNTRSSSFSQPAQPTAREPQAPFSNELHLAQLSFLTNVGEMAKVAALQNSSCGSNGWKRQQLQSHHQYQDSHAEWDAEVTPIGRGKKLCIDKLVHAEGQRVRLRFVPSSSTYSQQKNFKKREENTSAAEFYIGAATSISTILSSFAPPKASYWEDDRLVVPYPGERCGPAAQPHRGNRSDENGITEKEGEEGGDGSATRNSSWKGDDEDVYYPPDEYEDGGGAIGPEGMWDGHGREDNTMRSYRKLITQNRCQNEPVFHDAFFLDTGNITGGERRKKLIVLPSYRASVISFVDNKVLKKDINSDFYVQHPELERREIKLTHMRRIRADLLNFALEETSPIEVVTVSYANWYLERLIMRGMVGKRNRRLALAVCILLAIKFVETGDIHRKIQYAKARFRQDDAFTGVTWTKVQAWEFTAYVGLEFTLLPDNGNKVVETHLQRLLGQINLTAQEYYSKKFALP